MEALNSDVQLLIVLVLVAGSAGYMARYGFRRIRQILAAVKRPDACQGCATRCADDSLPPRFVPVEPLGRTRDEVPPSQGNPG